MNSRLAQSWPGFLATDVTLGGANEATAGLSGDVVHVRGTDPLPFARDAVTDWLGGTSAQPVSRDPTSDSPSAWQRYGVAGLGIVVALLLVAFGLYAVVKDA